MIESVVASALDSLVRAGLESLGTPAYLPLNPDDPLERPRYETHWRRSEHRRAASRRVLLGATLVILCIVGTAAILTYNEKLQCSTSYASCETDQLWGAFWQSIGIAALIAVPVSLIFTAFYWKSARRAHADHYMLEKAGEKLANLDAQAFELDGGDNLELAGLWRSTQLRLSVYHAIATRQAQVSFNRAQWAMRTGFAILLLAVIYVPFADEHTQALVAGALGAVAAGLAGYVSRTMIRSQEAAANHLRRYFLQPLEFSRFLMAERLLAGASAEVRERGILLLVEGVARYPRDEISNGNPGDAQGQ